MGFGDLFNKRKDPPSSSSSSHNRKYSNSRPNSPVVHQFNNNDSNSQETTPLPDKNQYPVSYKLTKQLIREGKVHWNCCKCGNMKNIFSVRRSDLFLDNLYQPFFTWGDSFCNSCSHNFCENCIENHS